jgi:PPP family 3-phenylpropionic acid transporter
MASARATGVRLSLFYGTLFLSVGLLAPYWPVWLAHRGMGPGQIGLLMAISSLTRTVTTPAIGALVDRRGDRRRPMLVLAVVSACAYALFGLAHGFWLLAALTILAAAAFTPIMPLGDSLTLLRSAEGRLDYGRIRLWGSLSFIVASTIGGAVIERHAPDSLPWLLGATLAALIGACAVLPDVRVADAREADARVADVREADVREADVREADVREADVREADVREADVREDRAIAHAHAHTGERGLRRLAVQPVFLLFLAAASAIHISHVVYYGFGALHWQAAGLSLDAIGLLWAEGVLAEVVVFAGAAVLLRRVSPPRLLALAGVAAALRWTVLGLTTEPLALILVQSLHAFSFGACHLGAMHFIAAAAPRSASAGAQALYSSLATGLLPGVAMLGAGRLYSALAGAAYLVTAAVALIAAALAMALDRRWRGGALALDASPPARA